MAGNIDQLPSNIIIVTQEGKPTQALVFYLQSIQKATQSGGSDITALQKEVDDTQTGTGLNTGGNYVPSMSSQYINGATSLFTADLLLDTAIFTHTRELITQLTLSATLSEESQTVLANASAGEIEVTLPNPANMFSGGRSKIIGISKIDNSINKVKILPSGTELICGEVSQEIKSAYNILNFITDGTNWYLGA